MCALPSKGISMDRGDDRCATIGRAGDRSCMVLGASKSVTCVTLPFVRRCAGVRCSIRRRPGETVVASG